MPQHDIYDDSCFIAAIEKIGKSSAPEIAAKVGCNARIATIRLKRLVAKEKVKSEKISGRWVFWI